jgi:hypothetical protein
MRSAIATVAAWLACSACTLAGSAPPEPVGPGQPFRLKVGDSTRVDGDALVIGFEGVTADSRCAKGEQCIWAGDATVRVWLQQAGGPKLTQELHTHPNPRQSDNAPSPRLRLVRLDPVRITGKAIAQGDYVATLELDREASGGATER